MPANRTARLLRPAAFCLVMLACGQHGAAAAPDLPWRAQWVTPPGDQAAGFVRENSWWCFRKTFSLDERPDKAWARIACDSKYWLWINGQPVVFEGQLKRGPTPAKTYYDRVDLSGTLREGDNAVAVLVWHFGKQGMSHKDSGRVGLLFEGAAGAQSIVSDGSWRVLRHPAYGSTGPPHPNWRLPESNVAFDARRDPGAWWSNEFDDRHWARAAEAGKPPVGPWNQLVERPIPQWRLHGIRPYENAEQMPRETSGGPIVARLPHNAQITPILDITAPAGLTIDIHTDNYRGGGEPNVRAEYITREGRQRYESLGWMNGHEVVYTAPPGVKVHAFGYRESGFDTDLAGRFECDDASLNTLWQKAQRTLYVNMRDTYFDCPGRERAQWWGDVTLELQQAFYGLDRRADALARKAIRELAGWQRASGELYSPVPAGNYDNELPMQMLASVGRFGFWEYYRHTADRATIEHVYPAVKRYLSLWRLQENGLVSPRQGGWTWGDWGKNKDMPLLYNAWYYLALDGQSRMAELLGEERVAAESRLRMRRVHAAFNRIHWTGEAYRSPNHKGPVDDRGQALAVVAGLAGPDKHAAITGVLREQHHASPYMEKYVLEALLVMGETRAALKRMRTRYAPMIDSPLTTLWEGWGVGRQGYGGGSYNHAWSGGPLSLLSQYVAGIDPLEPGYGRVGITPRLGDLRRAAATVASPRGPIRVEFTQTDNAMDCVVKLPGDCEAVLTLPVQGGPRPRLASAGKTAAATAGVRFGELTVEHACSSGVRLLVPPGDHGFSLVFDDSPPSVAE